MNKVHSTISPDSLGKYWADKSEVERQYFEETAVAGADEVAANTLFRVGASGRINDPEYVGKIQDYAPDVILVMGTSLVSRKIIGLSKLESLNIHTGLSPYYRGSNTNFWPLVHGRPEYCGVTVHRLTSGIDSGGIVVQERPEIKDDDTFFSINSKCILLGIDAAIRSVIELNSKPLETTSQWEKGRLFLERDFNAKWINRYYKRVDSGMFPEYVERERRGEIRHPRVISSEAALS